MKKVIIFFYCFCVSMGYAQNASFKRANLFLEDSLKRFCPVLGVYPSWIDGGECFWYNTITDEGVVYYIVDPARKIKRQMFFPSEMAELLKQKLGKDYDNKTLRLSEIDFKKGNIDVFTFSKGGKKFRYWIQRKRLDEVTENSEGDKLSEEDNSDIPFWQSVSTDGTYKVYAFEHNLYLIKGDTSVQLTNDGILSHSYSVMRDKNVPGKSAPAIKWIGNEPVFYVLRQDRSKVEDAWVINSLAKPRPKLKTYKFPMPGEKNVFTYDLHLFYPALEKHIVVDIDKYPDQTVEIIPTDLKEYPESIYFTRKSRTCCEMELCRVDTRTGDVCVVIHEKSEPYFTEQLFDCRILNGGKDILWWSERTGWGHYYLYDSTGKIKNVITSGEYVACHASRIDLKNRTFIFEGYGKEKGINPNYRFYYKVDLDGSNLCLLTPGDGYHSIEAEQGSKYFLDTYSRVDNAPVTMVRNYKGKQIMQLEKVSVVKLEKMGWKYPERIVVKAADGITDLYGVMYTPVDMDSSKSYPIIAYVYPGPQEDQVPQMFSLDDNCNNSLAQLGFIVVHVGFRGGNMYRGKKYYTYGYGNLRDYPLEDCKNMIEQLAEKYSFIDLDKVGIYGHSGGGFMSATSILTYPEFYKVAIAASGNYDNNIYTKWWGEMYHGVKMIETKAQTKEINYKFETKIPTTIQLADRLKGKLLLITGDVDNNVHPANTYRLAHALIEADKRFDMLVIPGADHNVESRYYYNVIRHYFIEHFGKKYLDGADFKDKN